jgi:GNAT superfamily N-acetyltransferase
VRFKYTLDLSLWNEPLGDVSDCQVPGVNDAPKLPTLLLAAYHGTADDEGEKKSDADAFVQKFFSEAPILSCSRILVKDDVLQAACLISMWESAPRITTIMTHPDRKNQGLGRLLLIACLRALRDEGHRSVNAWITAGNAPSERLFSSIGFHRMER